MLRRLLVIAYATLCLATAAPYVSVTSTEDHNNGEEASRIDLPLSLDDIAEQENDGNIAESPPEASYLDPAEDDVDPRQVRAHNFLRLGRSSSSGAAAAKVGKANNARYSRGGEVDDNFIRLGRSATSFVRFGRRDAAEGDAKTLATRGANSNFIRLGRSKTEPSNYIRFGRAGNGGSGFIRFGRAGGGNDFGEHDQHFGNDSSSRFSRSSKADSNFIRFGRDKLLNSNFMRLGRSDHFMRLGRGDNFLRFGKQDNFHRFSRGSADNFIRFGRGKSGEALFGRGKLTDRNFIRLGRSGGGANDAGSYEGGDDRLLGGPSKYAVLDKRTVPDKVNSNFMRFGRDAELVEENPQSSNNRSKRSLVTEDEVARADYNDDEVEDAALPFRYYSPLANAPFTPEFTVLPSLYAKRATGGELGNFIRFG